MRSDDEALGAHAAGPRPRIRAADAVYETMRGEIVSGELKGGAQLSIYRLAERFGVSRTPVRDAVLRLVDAGLVEIQRNRGVTVRGTRVADVRDVFDLRILLEVPATARAASAPSADLIADLESCLDSLTETALGGDAEAFSRVDRHLHRLILRSSGNERLLATVEGLRDSIQARGVTTLDHSRSLSEVRAEHEPIVAAIVAGRVEAAAAAMRTHLVATAWLLMRQTAAATGEALPAADRLGW